MRLPVRRHEKKRSRAGQLFFPGAAAGLPLKLAVKVVQKVRQTIPTSPNNNCIKRKGKNFNFEFTSSETFLECVLNFPFCNRIICMYFWHKIHTKVLPKLRNATARFILDYRKRRCMYSHQLDCLMSIWCTNACVGFCYNQQSNLCYVDDWYFGSFCIHCIWLRIRFPNI